MTSLSYLDRLEAESIHILRETVAEDARPVMLYSIGKDSAVMLHLAKKAFSPAPLPFPLLHVDTTWKFRDMYALRDKVAAEPGIELIVHKNPEAEAKGINPFDHGPLHTDLWKTEGLRQALDRSASTRPSAAPAATRRKAAPRNGCSLPRSQATAGTRARSGPNCGRSTIRREAGRERPRLPAVQLDRARRLAIHRAREHRGRAALFRRRAPDGRARRPAC